MSNELDKQFSDKLQGYESLVDAEALWEAVKPATKKRPWMWLWLLFVVGLLGAGTGWYYTNQTATAALATTINSDLPINNLTTTEGSNLEYPEQNSQVNEQVDKEIVRKEESESQSVVSGTNDLMVATPIARARPADENDNSQTATEASVNSRSIAEFADVQVQETSTVESLNHPDELNETKTGAVVNETTQRTTIVDRQELVPGNNRLSVTKLALIPTLEAGLLADRSNDVTLPVISDLTERSYWSKGSPWFLELNAGYYLLDRTLETSHDSVYGNWLDTREQTESTLEANSFDVTLGYELSDRLELRSGIAYNQLNTAFNYAISSMAIDTVEGLQTIVYEGDTIVDSIFGPIARYTTSLQEKRTYNSFRQLEIPFLVAYNLGERKLHYQVEAGVRLLLQRRWEGNILNADDEFLDLSQTDWYENSLSLSFQAGLKAVYDLSAQTSIVGSVNLRYYPQAFTTETAPFKEQYQLSGATIGLRHNF